VTGEPFAGVQGADFHRDMWVIDQWTGEPFNRDPLEHDAFAWMTDKELLGLRLTDPRLPQLPCAALRPAR